MMIILTFITKPRALHFTQRRLWKEAPSLPYSWGNSGVPGVEGRDLLREPVFWGHLVFDHKTFTLLNSLIR